MGNMVTCVDANAARVHDLRCGHIPFHEPELEPLVAANVREGRLNFTTSLAETVPGTAIFFIAVGTPLGEDGAANLQHVFSVAHALGTNILHDCIVAGKSTVPVGTIDRIHAILDDELGKRGVTAHVDVVSNPEFLKEGSAVRDFMRPERVIIGEVYDVAVDIRRSSPTFGQWTAPRVDRECAVGPE